MKLNVAILEDNPSLLKDHKLNLEATDLVNVVAFATNSTKFLNNEKTRTADALLLDIDLGGSSNMSGLEVAYKLKLPVLFVSGHNAPNLKEIEKLENEFDLIVDHITKPFTEKEFLKKATKFINEVLESLESKFVLLDFADCKRNKIMPDKIVFLESETGKSGASNNKRIFFTDKEPETLNNFSFVDMEKLGFDSKIFIQPHKSFRVNISKVKCYNNEHTLDVEIKNDLGKNEVKKIPVSENYRKQTFESLKRRFSLP